MKQLLFYILVFTQIANAGLPEAVTLDTSNWIPFPISNFDEMKGTVLDMSHLLEAPSGKHGFLTVQGDKFVFEDGTPARFWGGNLFGEANFPNKEQAQRLADIIARSGANMIRLHHLDVVKPWTDKVVQQSLFGGQTPHTTRQLDKPTLDRFHYFWHCLKERGIYIFLSHISSRYIMPGDDFPGTQAGFDDVAQGFKVEGMFDPYLIELQKEYLEALLLAPNPYTGLNMIEDPALVLTEIINENTLIWNQPEGWFAIESDYYRSMLQQRFARWLRAKYEDEKALVKAWSEEKKIALLATEKLKHGNIAIAHIYASQKTWPISRARQLDTYRFLNELQHDYYQDMAQFLKGLGLKIPLAGSNHWCRDVADLYVNAELDYVDRHAYWTHPENEYNYIAGQGVQSKPMVKDPSGGNIGSFAQRRIQGKPYTASEWHNPLPNPYRAEGTPLIAAYSCIHDWHPMHYAYWGTSDLAPPIINSFEAMFDPTQMNLIPISALLFHRQDFQEDQQGIYRYISPKEVYNPDLKASLPTGLALYGKAGLTFHKAASQQSNLKAKASPITTVTGEIHWDTDTGIVRLDAPRTQGVIGFVGKKKLVTRDFGFEMKTPFAVVVASSLSEEPLKTSNHILISTSGDARHTDIQMASDFSLIEKTGRFPFLMEPIEGDMTIKTKRPLTVTALDASGKPVKTIKVKASKQGYRFELKAAYQAMHYEIKSMP